MADMTKRWTKVGSGFPPKRSSLRKAAERVGRAVGIKTHAHREAEQFAAELDAGVEEHARERAQMGAKELSDALEEDERASQRAVRAVRENRLSSATPAELAASSAGLDEMFDQPGKKQKRPSKSSEAGAEHNLRDRGDSPDE